VIVLNSKTCTECINSEWLGPIDGRSVFRPFQDFIATAVAVHHPITQVNITHMGCIAFDD
jgi:hypothetical protein